MGKKSVAVCGKEAPEMSLARDVRKSWSEGAGIAAGNEIDFY
jgi:hypothetical protein